MLGGSLQLPEPQSWVGVAAGSAAVALSASAAGSQSSGQLLTLQTPLAWSSGHGRGPLVWQSCPGTRSEG